MGLDDFSAVLRLTALRHHETTTEKYQINQGSSQAPYQFLDTYASTINYGLVVVDMTAFGVFFHLVSESPSLLNRDCSILAALQAKFDLEPIKVSF